MCPEKNGFTLFELLIAMMLTAVIGAVMFKTWDMVITGGNHARQVVTMRERERSVFAILDNDFAGMLAPAEETPGLPVLSRERVGLSDEFYLATGRKKKDEDEKGISVLMAFPSGFSLKTESLSVGYPVCVEYLLKTGSGSAKSLLRRERDYCGTSGDFPWMETLMLDNLEDAGLELVFQDGTRLEKWNPRDLLTAMPVAVRFHWRERGSKEAEMMFPLFERRVEVGWEEKKF